VGLRLAVDGHRGGCRRHRSPSLARRPVTGPTEDIGFSAPVVNGIRQEATLAEEYSVWTRRTGRSLVCSRRTPA
jgi:hypothetical protein